MKKMFLAMVLALMLALGVGTAFADTDVDIDNSPGAVGNKGTISAPITTFSPSATVGAISQQQGLNNNNTGTLLSPSANAVGVAGNVVGIGPGGVVISPTNTLGQQQGINSTISPHITVSPTIKVEPEIGVGNISGISLGSKTFSPSAEANQKQKQQQKQGQDQGQQQGQFGYVNIETPQPLLALPAQEIPTLNFGSGRMKDVTASMPNFAIFGIKKYAGEAIRDVLNVNANVKFKNYFKAVIADAKDLAGEKGFKSSEVRLMVICAEAQKSWNSGGNIGGGGSALSTGSPGGGSAAGSIIPSWGGTKADDLFTIIYVKIAL